jgi:two-component system OmpR family sensor kinase
VVTAALAAVALIAANAAGLLLLRSYLTDRVDQQLERMARTHALARLPDSGPGVSRLWRLPAGGGPSKAVVIYRADGTLLPGMPPADQLSPPQLGS